MRESAENELLRSIPAVDAILADQGTKLFLGKYSQELVKRAIRRGLSDLRSEIRFGKAGQEDCRMDSVVQRVGRVLETRVGRKLRLVINATGVIVHTNLGRSPLAKRVVDRIAEAASCYSNLEYDLREGRRGERNSHLRALMEELTGAEAALAVNNNAAAVLLALSTLAAGKEVIVSRGELIEIGGSFRIPEVMARSGATLREVGTTNRTHPKDYVSAINESTALILKVHPSNYRIEGFRREVELEELVLIGRSKGVPTMMDLGSGCLLDLSAYGLPGETTVQEVLEAGVDVVSFSGDKLLGGPQAGIIAGRAEFIERMRTNHLARALRMDKMTLAGLEATLEEYTRPDGPMEGVPTLGMIMRSSEELDGAARRLAEQMAETLGQDAHVEIILGAGRVGGGAFPMGELPGPRVSVKPAKMSAGRLEQNLRAGDPPVIVLVKDDAVVLDPRTLLEGQAESLPGLVASALGDSSHGAGGSGDRR